MVMSLHVPEKEPRATQISMGATHLASPKLLCLGRV